MKSILVVRKRGVSPLVGVILMIAMVIVAGTLTFIVLSGVFLQQTPVDVEIENLSDWKSTNEDVLVDQFSITVKNLRTETVTLKMTNITVINATSREALPSWRVVGTDFDYELAGNQIKVFTLKCSNPTHELTPNYDRIQVQLQASAGDSSKTVKSQTHRTGDTYGPITLTAESFHVTDEYLNLTIQNNGTLDLDLIVEIEGVRGFLFNNTAYITQSSFPLEGVNIGVAGVITPGEEKTLRWNVTTTGTLPSGTYFVRISIFDTSFRGMGFSLVNFQI